MPKSRLTSWHHCRRDLIAYLAVLFLLSTHVCNVAAEEIDVSARMVVTKTGLVFNRTTNTFDTLVTVSSASSDPVFAPARLVIEKISNPTVSLFNASGTTIGGRPYIALPIPATGLIPRAKITDVVLKFRNPNRASFTFTQSILANLLGSLSLSIESPAAGAVVHSETVTVSGRFVGPERSGIVVNGVPASISGDKYIAPQVPLTVGPGTLLARITSIDGRTAQTTLNVTSDGFSAFSLEVDPPIGTGSLTTTFRINNRTGQRALRVDFDFDDNETIDATMTSDRESVRYVYSTAGTFNPRAILTTVDGQTFTTSATIVVESREDLDTSLRVTWNELNAALLIGNVERAGTYLTDGARARLGPHFVALGPRIKNIAQSVSVPQMLGASGFIGEYVATRAIDGMQRAFLIYFIRDADGVWRVDAM